jgi:hypothetical protein
MRLFDCEQQQLKPLLSDTDIVPEITRSSILQKRGTCFSHHVVLCTVQPAGVVGTCVVPPYWWAVLQYIRKTLLYLLLRFASQTVFVHIPMILASPCFLIYARVCLYVFR